MAGVYACSGVMRIQLVLAVAQHVLDLQRKGASE
jgi:hypothetical protein